MKIRIHNCSVKNWWYVVHVGKIIDVYQDLNRLGCEDGRYLIKDTPHNRKVLAHLITDNKNCFNGYFVLPEDGREITREEKLKRILQ